MNLPDSPLRPQSGISARIKFLQDKVHALEPKRAPGILTSRTTRGTTRQPINTGTSSGGSGGNMIPRWG
jgi:hypothetical protein